MSVQSRPQQTKRKNIEIHKYMDILCFCCTYLSSDQGWECLMIRLDIFIEHFSFLFLQFHKSSKAALSLLRSTGWWMASTDCLESPQISRNCGTRLTLFIYFQYAVSSIRFQLYHAVDIMCSVTTGCICSCYINFSQPCRRPILFRQCIVLVYVCM